MNSGVPRRGDVVWINMSPQAGREQMGRRPALVLSHESYNGASGLAIFCPITSRVKGYPFEVRIPDNLPVHGIVLADQIRSLDWRERKAEFACQIPAPVVAQVILTFQKLLEE